VVPPQASYAYSSRGGCGGRVHREPDGQQENLAEPHRPTHNIPTARGRTTRDTIAAMATHTDLDDLRSAIDDLRVAPQVGAVRTEAIARLVDVVDRASTQLRTQDVDAVEREQLVRLVADAISVVARAFGGGAEA